MKFSHKVVAASSALLLITVTLLSIQQLYTVRQSVENHINDSLEELVGGVKNTVESEMNAKKVLAEATTQAIEVSPKDHNFITTIIEKPAVKKAFLAIGFGYQEDGFVLENDDNWDAGADYDPRVRPWYIGAKQQNRLVVTEPYVDASTQNVIISIGTPVNQDGQFIAGMFYDIELSNLAALVNQVNLFDAGYLFLVTSDGTTIAHPDSANNGKKLSSYLPNVSLTSGNQHIDIDGQPYLVQLTSVGSENWYIGAILDENLAYKAIADLRQNAIIYTLLAVVLSVIALNVLIRVLMKPLTALNKAIDDVASGQGDLTQRLDTNTDQEFSQLAAGFNQFTENLQTLIIQSKQTGDDIKQGSDHIAQGAQQSSDAINTQLQELEQLATAMNEMAVTATEVANNAQGASAAAQQADDATKEGSRVVTESTESINLLSQQIDQAVAEVHGLESATGNIETILSVINDIADQTNLLALNAAIEAARAGESGRGFAVVADEVRTLAQRTQESTTEIRNMIEQLQAGATSVAKAMNQSKDVAMETVERAEHATKALISIGDSIQSISDMNMQIASAAEEQSLVAEEINNNTFNIKDLATQVSHAAQEANEAMHTQSEQAQKQHEILSRFTV